MRVYDPEQINAGAANIANSRYQMIGLRKKRMTKPLSMPIPPFPISKYSRMLPRTAVISTHFQTATV